jgi:hypothetical protein
LRKGITLSVVSVFTGANFSSATVVVVSFEVVVLLCVVVVLGEGSLQATVNKPINNKHFLIFVS